MTNELYLVAINQSGTVQFIRMSCMGFHHKSGFEIYELDYMIDYCISYARKLNISSLYYYNANICYLLLVVLLLILLCNLPGSIFIQSDVLLPQQFLLRFVLFQVSVMDHDKCVNLKGNRLTGKCTQSRIFRIHY